MKTALLLAALFLYASVLMAQAPTWMWAQHAGSSWDEYSVRVRTDAAGNVYATGTFTSPKVGFGSDTVVNTATGTSDIFIVKYDTAGNVKWAKSAGGIGDDIVTDMNLDSAGNIYLTGTYKDQPPTFGSFTLGSPVVTDAFIAKYSNNGTAVWAKRLGGDYYDKSDVITVMNDGSFYVGGSYNSSLLSFGSSVSLTSPDTWGNYFVAHYDASGNALWAKGAHCNQGSAKITGLISDKAGNIYIAGVFDGTSISVGTYTFQNPSLNTTIYFAKLDGNGNSVWAKKYDHACPGNAVVQLKPDGNGHFYMAGNLDNLYQATLDGISLPVYATVFVGRFDTSGTPLWIKGVRAVDDCAKNGCAELVVDGTGHPYLTGGFYASKMSFGQDTLYNTNGTWGYSDIYLAKYDSLGNTLWIKNNLDNGVSTSTSYAIGLAIDSKLNLYSTGGYLNVGLVLDSFMLGNAGGYDYYLAKMKQCNLASPTISLIGTSTLSSTPALYYQWYRNGNLIAGATGQTYNPAQSGSYTVVVKDGIGCSASSLAQAYNAAGIATVNGEGVNVFPNPSEGTFTINLPSAGARVVISDVAGRKLMDVEMSGKTSQFRISESGLFFVHIYFKEGSAVTKLIAIH